MGETYLHDEFSCKEQCAQPFAIFFVIKCSLFRDTASQSSRASIAPGIGDFTILAGYCFQDYPDWLSYRIHSKVALPSYQTSLRATSHAAGGDA